jgi:hypothetical protein
MLTYLDTIAVMIALVTAGIALALTARENAHLSKENKRLRMRVRELNKQVELHA